MAHLEKLSFFSGGNLVRVELVCMQYNISDSQALFCFVFVLRMASIDILFLCSVGQEKTWLCSYFAFKFYAKINAFVLIKKSVLYFSFNFIRVLAFPIFK